MPHGSRDDLYAYFARSLRRKRDGCRRLGSFFVSIGRRERTTGFGCTLVPDGK
ncbi:MAG: hypothetical protein ACE5EQ_11120 [Phycisphaerae bacterium]